MLHRTSYFFELCSFRNQLERFHLQDVLTGLPFSDFLNVFGKKIHLSPSLLQEKMTFFLENSDQAIQALSFFLSFYPDIVGTEKSHLLANASHKLQNTSTALSPKANEQRKKILHFLYTLTYDTPRLKAWTENFENLLNFELDMRLHAAALERLHDNFLQDDCLNVLLPDWILTTKENLAFERQFKLHRLPDSQDKEKTAFCLVKSVVLMILRNGFIVMPSQSICRVDEKARICFINSRFPVLLKPNERLFISSFLESLILKDYTSAAKALFVSGYLPDTLSISKTTDIIKTADGCSPSFSKKISSFLNLFIENGISLPFSLRYCALTVTATENICHTFLNARQDVWASAAKDFSDFLRKGKEIQHSFPPCQEQFNEFKNVFSIMPDQKERLIFQNKKLPRFQEDFSIIKEILYKQTVGAKFQSGALRKRFWLLITLIISIFITLLFFQT